MGIDLSQKCHVFLNTSFLLLLCCFLGIHLHSSQEGPQSHLTGTHLSTKGDGCKYFESLTDHKSKCSYLKEQHPCVPQGYIDYLHLFYCLCGSYPLLGYILLALWLLVLFYLLGNTASQYFCSSLESLSRVLRLSPSMAGVTLLSLGNGAPDVFSSIVSFAGDGAGQDGAGEVGISSVLGGGFFVSSIVVGIISIVVAGRAVQIDQFSFVRDVCFFIFALCSLLAVLITGKIGLWGSICFLLLYLIYVFIVWMTQVYREKQGELVVPLLEAVQVEQPLERDGDHNHGKLSHTLSWILYIIEMPLYLPRRLTIPDVSEERWSRPFAVASVIFSPILLSVLWNSVRGDMTSELSLVISMVATLVGMVLGIVAFETTEDSDPPRKFLFPWLAGGFLMSVIWAYITATELVSLLLSLGVIMGISPSMLGLTVLAWGNSIGDLIANAAMAVNGGQMGAQVAISGCYAGPIFNTLVGLGLSLVMSSWAVHPSPYVIPGDPALFQTLGFLIVGLLWALVVLPRRGMRLDRVLGVGLLAIYLCFLCLRVFENIGIIIKIGKKKLHL